jgi:hypothetical protein
MGQQDDSSSSKGERAECGHYMVHDKDEFELCFPAGTPIGALWFSEIGRMIAHVTLSDEGKSFDEISEQEGREIPRFPEILMTHLRTHCHSTFLDVWQDGQSSLEGNFVLLRVFFFP